MMQVKSEIDTKDGREWLWSMLKSQEVTISFTKKDGTDRKMVCTLVESKIPSDKLPKNVKKSKSDAALAVFDVETQDWRSFRWDSVKKVEFSLGEK